VVSISSSRVTIADIARIAGVSTPTVSKVLNGKPGVSESTRERVSGLLREHEYEPRRSTPNGVIELVLGELDSPWSSSLVKAVEEAAFNADMGVVLSRQRAGTDEKWLDMIASRDSDGVVFGAVESTPSQRARLAEIGLPFVMVDPHSSQSLDIATVGITHWRGAHSATEYLISLGHTQLAMVGGPLVMLYSQARADGFRAAAASASIAVSATSIVHTEFGYAEGRDAALELLSADSAPTAIFAASDEQALGVYEAARRLGLRIPEDLSVVGFNDAPIASWASPPLTTVREPLQEMANQAVSLLRRLIDGGSVGAAIELATELVIRESTAAPRSSR